jgi:hypothetical protein
MNMRQHFNAVDAAEPHPEEPRNAASRRTRCSLRRCSDVICDSPDCDSPPSFRESARNDGREEEEERSTMSKARRPRHGPPTWIGVQSM